MSEPDSPYVTLAFADNQIPSCWWEVKVKQGLDCFLLMQHTHGKIMTGLEGSNALQPKAEAISSSTSLTESMQCSPKLKIMLI